MKKNIFYQVIYQVILLVVPLILSKYVTNIINKDVMGVYNYSYSIANYFVIFGMLGLQKYGTRLISQNRNDSIKLRTSFWSIYYLHLFISFISVVSYYIVILSVNLENINIFVIQGLFVASVIFDITWLYYGLENFKGVVFKNLVVKLVEVTLVLILIKSNDDLWIYTIIMSGSILLGHLVIFPYALKYVPPIKVSISDIKTHLKPMLILSVSVLATSIYAILDKTLLGALSPGSKGDVALYEYSDKIVRIPLLIIAAIETVMLPRMSKLSLDEDKSKMKNSIYISSILISMISIGAMFGVASIAKVFVNLWYGEDYLECQNVVLYLSPLVFIVSFGDIFRSQYLIPMKKDFLFTITIVIGAIMNLILNLVLIPYYGLNGAVIATLIAETTICVLQMIICWKSLPVLKYLINCLPFFIFGIGIFMLNKVLESSLGISYLTLILQIITGMMIYVIISLLYLYLAQKKVIVVFFKKNKNKSEDSSYDK